MKKEILSLVLVIGIVSFSAMGETVSVNKDVKDFNGISIKYPGTVCLKQCDTESLAIEGNIDTLEHISVEVKDKKLIIKDNRSWFEGLFTSINEVVFNISVKNINSVSVSGSDTLNILTPIKTNSLLFKLSGSGDLNSQEPIVVENDFSIDCSGSHEVIIKNLIAKTLNFKISGSGKITVLGGNTDKQTIDTSGSGRYDALNFSSKETIIKSSGSCKINVNVSDSLDVNISGSGKVFYKGNPTKIEQNISGSGKIQKANE